MSVHTAHTGIASSGGVASQPRSEIITELERLNEIVAECHASLDRLSNKIDPVCTPAVPAELSKTAEEVLNTPLANKLHNCTLQLLSLSDRMNRLFIRCEL